MGLFGKVVAACVAVGTFSTLALADPGVAVVPGDMRRAEISSATDRDVFVVDGLAGGDMTISVVVRSGDLVPTIEVFGPGTDLTQEDPAPDAAVSVTGDTVGARLRRVDFVGTGPHSVVVSGDAGTTGSYNLRVTTRRPRGQETRVLLTNGAVQDILFPGFGGGSVDVQVEVESGAIIPRPQIVDPNGLVLEGATAAITRRDRKFKGRRVALPPGPTGSYRLRLRGPVSGGPSAVLVGIRSAYSTVRRTRVAIPALEPVIGSVSPSIVAGGDQATVSGANFSPRARVLLHRTNEADIQAEVLSVASGGTSLSFRVPKTDGGGDPLSGLYSVIVSNPEGQFAFVNEAIGIESEQAGSGGVTPNTGPITGGTLVVVTGDGFISGITARLRDVGAAAGSGVSVAVTFVSSTRIEFTTPLRTSAGTVDIVLRNPGSTKDTVRSAAFTFTDETESRFFADATADVVPATSQSGDEYRATRGAIVDLDLDGRSDLVLQSAFPLTGGASLRILHQRPDGSLADDTHRSIPDRFGGFSTEADLGEGPGLAVGDVDGDGFPDIVCASEGFVPRTGNEIDYLVGFEPQANFYSEQCGTIGDDIITWNDHYSATRILRNDGNGNFFSSPFATSASRRVPRVGFFVEEQDAIDADARSRGATLSTSTTTFTNLTAATDPDPSVDAFNGVGDTRVRTANTIDAAVPGTGFVRVFNTVTLTFDVYEYTSIVDPGTGNRQEFVLKPGVQLARTYEGGVQVENVVVTIVSTAAPGFANRFVYGGERFEGGAVAVGDLDGNGSGEIVVGSDLAVHGTYCFSYDQPNGTTEFFGGIARPSTRVLVNGVGGGRGAFTESAFPLFDPSSFAFPDTGYYDRAQAIDLALGDVNGDGRQDIVIVSDRRFTFPHTRPGVTAVEYKPGTRIFLNAGSGRFNDATRSNMPVVDEGPVGTPAESSDFYAAARVVLGDIDGDGDLDMVLASPTGSFIDAGRPWTRVLVNRDGPNGPTGIFDDETDARVPAVVAGGENWQANSVALHDLNNDGFVDLILTTRDAAVLDQSPGTRVLMNDGTGVFRHNPPPFAADTFIPPSGGGEDWSGDLVLVGDVDDDGRVDVVISEDADTPNATRVLLRK